MNRKPQNRRQRPPLQNAKPIQESGEIRTGEVVNLSYSACGVIRSGGKVVFVPYTVTGDEVEFTVTRDQKTYAEGRLVSVMKESSKRENPPCPYFGKCGGCQWQHIEHGYQLTSKHQITADLLRRIGGIAAPHTTATKTAGYPWHYRHRVRFQAGRDGDNISLGFAKYGTNDVVDTERCMIIAEPVEALLRKVRLVKESLIGVYDLEIAYSAYDDNAVFWATCRDITRLKGFDKIAAIFKGGVIQDKDSGKVHEIGEPWLMHAVSAGAEEIPLKVYSGGFLQSNPAVNSAILSILLERKEIFSGKVLELFSGSGNFTLPLSRIADSVTAIEGSPRSHLALRENIAKQRARNVRVLSGDVVDEVVRLINRKEAFDTIFLDPPRIGAKELSPYLPSLKAKNIVYLSCNPSTLARDIAPLIASGYSLDVAMPFDMFPQTFHIEVLAVLRKD